MHDLCSILLHQVQVNTLHGVEVLYLNEAQSRFLGRDGYRFLGQEGVRGRLEAEVRRALCHDSQACSQPVPDCELPVTNEQKAFRHWIDVE